MIYFFVHIKMSYYWFNTKDLTDLYKKQMADVIVVVVKKKLLNIIIKTGGLKMQMISIDPWQKKKKKQKENIKEIDTEM